MKVVHATGISNDSKQHHHLPAIAFRRRQGLQAGITANVANGSRELGLLGQSTWNNKPAHSHEINQGCRPPVRRQDLDVDKKPPATFLHISPSCLPVWARLRRHEHCTRLRSLPPRPMTAAAALTYTASAPSTPIFFCPPRSRRRQTLRAPD
jgi:hypothetical protein